MESAEGRISSIDGDVATVVVAAPLACARCAAGKGCGAGLLASTGGPKTLSVRMPAGVRLQVDDVVRLSIAPRHLLRAATLAYGLPLAGALGALAIAWIARADIGDAAGVVVALAGLVAGHLAGRWLLQRDAACEHFLPTLDGGAGASAR